MTLLQKLIVFLVWLLGIGVGCGVMLVLIHRTRIRTTAGAYMFAFGSSLVAGLTTYFLLLLTWLNSEQAVLGALAGFGVGLVYDFKEWSDGKTELLVEDIRRAQITYRPPLKWRRVICWAACGLVAPLVLVALSTYDNDANPLILGGAVALSVICSAVMVFLSLRDNFQS
jgi:hypothetical protein